jgi:hypothetical protein
MAYSVPRIEDVCSHTPHDDGMFEQSPRPLRKISVVKPVSSDALIGLLNGTSADSTFEFLERFFDHLAETNASRPREANESPSPAVEWGVAAEAIADSTSVEQAIGRTLVIANQMNREMPVDESGSLRSSDAQDEAPFFAFSVADSLPDFGDQSRYRTKFAKKVGRVLRPRRVLDAAVAS